MWEIAAIISKEISEKDAKQHFKSMITLGKVEFCMDKFEKATTLKKRGNRHQHILKIRISNICKILVQA